MSSKRRSTVPGTRRVAIKLAGLAAATAFVAEMSAPALSSSLPRVNVQVMIPAPKVKAPAPPPSHLGPQSPNSVMKLNKGSGVVSTASGKGSGGVYTLGGPGSGGSGPPPKQGPLLQNTLRINKSGGGSAAGGKGGSGASTAGGVYTAGN